MDGGALSLRKAGRTMIGKVLTRFIIPLLLLTVAAFAARFIFTMAPEPAEVEAGSQAIPVEVRTVHSGAANANVTTTGLVIPAKVMTITPEISGRIVQRTVGLVPGSRLLEGELIARISARDYALALRQEQSRVRSAELDVRTERARGDVARREWELLGGERTNEQEALALRQPHLVARRANLGAAESGVQRAKLNLSRATLRAPWNAIVAEITVEEGQIVGPGTKIARLIASDQMWVRASVPLDELDSLSIPGVNGEEGSTARVIHELGPGRQIVREGRVLRLESELDPQTRMAQLLIVVNNPLDEPAGVVPLLPGSYVSVEMTGRSVEGVFALFRPTLRGGDTVWIVDATSQLARRTVTVRFGGSTTVYVTGLEEGDRIVTTNLSLPIAGRVVSVQPSPTSVAASDGETTDG